MFEIVLDLRGKVLPATKLISVVIKRADRMQRNSDISKRPLGFTLLYPSYGHHAVFLSSDYEVLFKP